MVCGGATKVASVRKCQKFLPRQKEPVPTSSKIDPPLAQSKPIRDGRSTSVITFLRKGKNYCTIAAGREE